MSRNGPSRACARGTNGQSLAEGIAESRCRIGLRTGLSLFLLVPLVLPAAVAFSPLASALRFAYPIYLLVIALLLLRRRPALYPAFIVASFAYAPFLRRVADQYAGFSPYSLILLAPYVALLPAVPALLRLCLKRPSFIRVPYLVFLLCTIYASLISYLDSEIVNAFFEASKWILPIALSAFILARYSKVAEMREAVVTALCIALPVLSLYGVYQFVFAPIWDVNWMVNTNNPTFGSAAPFSIRVFSMLNAPFSAAVFCAYAVVLLAGRGPVRLTAGLSTIPLLALSLVRTAWIPVGVGLLLHLLNARPRHRLAALAGSVLIVIIVVAGLNSSSVPVEARLAVEDRFDTFLGVQSGTDTSALTRLDVYGSFYKRLSESPLGEGFGVNSSTVNAQSGKEDTGALDSLILEAFLTFGVIGGSAFFAAFFSVASATLRVSPQRRAALVGEYGVVLGMILIMPLGASSTGEVGALAWIAIGILLAERAAELKLAES